MRPIVALLPAILAVHCGLAQTSERTPRFLSLKECIELALQHNFDIQIERYTPDIARYNLSSSYGDYDPVFTFSAGDQFVKQPAEFDPKKSGVDAPYELTTDSFASGLHGVLPTGLSYELRASSDYFSALTDFSLNPTDAARFPPDGIRVANEYSAFAGVILRQPLLRNLWIDATRQRIWINQKNLKISEIAFRQQVMNTVTKVQLAYYELAFARERIRVQEKALELAARLAFETRRRVEVGDLPPLDEKQAESQLETSRSDLVLAQQAMAEQQAIVKNLLTDDFRQWADTDLQPADSLLAPVMTLDRTESWQNALGKRPDLLQFKVELEKHDILLRYERNQLFPNLDLVGSYGGRGVRDRFGSATEDVGSFNNPAYSYGVILSFPLANQAARNNYKAAQAVKKQALLQFKKLEQDILAQVEIAVTVAQTTFKRLDSTRQARVYSEAALGAEQTKLANGLSTSFIVLQFQERLTAARSAEIRALADYNRALVQLAFAEGTTLDRNQLTVEIKNPTNGGK